MKLTPKQREVLQRIYDGGSLAVDDDGYRTPWPSSTLRALVEKGLIVSPVVVSLTDAGREALGNPVTVVQGE